jgi:hypothetical protein
MKVTSTAPKRPPTAGFVSAATLGFGGIAITPHAVADDALPLLHHFAAFISTAGGSTFVSMRSRMAVSIFAPRP